MGNPAYFDAEKATPDNLESVNYNLYVIGDDGYIYEAIVIPSDNDDFTKDIIHFQKSKNKMLDRQVNNSGFMKVKDGVIYFVMDTGLYTSTVYIFQKTENDWELSCKSELNSSYTLYLEVSNGLVLAGGSGGLAISDNGGVTWRYPSLSSSAPLAPINTICEFGGLLFLGIKTDNNEGGLLVSSDKGYNWNSFDHKNTQKLLKGDIGKILPFNLPEDGNMVYLMQGRVGISRFSINQSSTNGSMKWNDPMTDGPYASPYNPDDKSSKDLVDGQEILVGGIFPEVGQICELAIVPDYPNIIVYPVHLDGSLSDDGPMPINPLPYFNDNGIMKMRLKFMPRPGRVFVLDSTKVLSGADIWENPWKKIDINN